MGGIYVKVEPLDKLRNGMVLEMTWCDWVAMRCLCKGMVVEEYVMGGAEGSLLRDVVAIEGTVW